MSELLLGELLMSNGGLNPQEQQIRDVSNAIEKYRHAGVMEERERCAKIVEGFDDHYWDTNRMSKLAEEIRKGD